MSIVSSGWWTVMARPPGAAARTSGCWTATLPAIGKMHHEGAERLCGTKITQLLRSSSKIGSARISDLLLAS